MKNMILSLAVVLAAFTGYSQSTMATKKYVDGIKEELLQEMSHFPYFDGTANNMRVSPVSGTGGFRFKDYSSEGDEFGMSFQPWGDAMWGFALWDKMGIPTSSRANPYFAVGPMGFRIPIGNIENGMGTIDWPTVWNGMNVSDQVFDSSNSNSRRSISSRAINSFIYYELPRAVGRYVATGNVHSATGVLKGAGEIATYDNIIEDAGYFAATSKVVKSVTYTDWTSDMTIEKDGVILNHMEFKDGKWHVYVDGHGSIKNHLLFTVEGAEDVTALSYTDQYGTVNFSRTKTVVAENRFGIATLDDIGGVRGIITNDICNIVTNEVSEWVITADNPEISLDGWYIELSYVRNVTTGEKIAVWNINHDSYTWLSAEGFSYTNTEYEVAAERFNDINGNKIYDDGEEIITFTVRAERKNRNALGLARMKDIEGVPTSKTVTNIVHKVVNTAGKYLWDAKDEVCWRVNMSGGFVDLVAVTNIDLTLPENHLALEAIENEWSAK